MARHNEGIEDLLDGLMNLDRQFPEINRHAIAIIAKRAVEIAKDNIEKGGNPTEPHSEYTPELTEKLRGGTTGDVLNETGKLKASIRITANTVAMGKVYVTIGSELIYAAIHEYGGHPGGAVKGISSDGKTSLAGYIPPRPYLRPAIQEAIFEAVDGDLDEKIARAYDLAVQKKNWRKAF